jgi:hypothetical protein
MVVGPTDSSIEFRKKGEVIDDFSSVRLANAIDLECLVDSLTTELVLDSPDFQLLTIIQSRIQNFSQ